MQPTDEAARALASRLRNLREQSWPDAPLTQAQLARVLRVSVPSISSWESLRDPKTPPLPRLHAYATFFATRRSVDGGRYRLLDVDQLSAPERARRNELAGELLALRAAAVGGRPGVEPASAATVLDRIGGGPWYFPDARPVTIVCAPLPAKLRQRMPHSDPRDPEYNQFFRYADLDALVELYGHLRAVNPDTTIEIRLASALEADDYTTHLVLLGGVDWNVVTRDMLAELPVPVAQVSRDEPQRGGFEVTDGGQRRLFEPTMVRTDSGYTLVEDVAHFFRGVNPFNRKRTVTICNGMFGRGTYAAVRTLTDPRFRDRNAGYVGQRFPGGDTYSILARVRLVRGEVVTPDWTLEDTRLHEWPEAAA
jgi:transcriptional regulator with XRE-family HTH domain